MLHYIIGSLIFFAASSSWNADDEEKQKQRKKRVWNITEGLEMAVAVEVKGNGWEKKMRCMNLTSLKILPLKNACNLTMKHYRTNPYACS